MFNATSVRTTLGTLLFCYCIQVVILVGVFVCDAVCVCIVRVGRLVGRWRRMFAGNDWCLMAFAKLCLKMLAASVLLLGCRMCANSYANPLRQICTHTHTCVSVLVCVCAVESTCAYFSFGGMFVYIKKWATSE